MIKKLHLVASLATIALLSSASIALGQIELGARVGVGLSNFLGDPDTEFEPKANFTGGVTLSYELNRSASIQPEVLYAVKGSKTQTEIDGVLADVTFNITYLEVPVLFRYSFSPRSGISPVIAIGPSVAWNIDARVKWKAVGDELEFMDPDETIKDIDLGVAAELGLDFRWDIRTISTSIRYTYGASNLVDNPDDPKHNGVLAATVGIGL